MTTLQQGRPLTSATAPNLCSHRRYHQHFPRNVSFRLRISGSYSLHLSNKCKREYTSVMIVPTGVGAAIGGYAGDALPVARALSGVVDCLITHPNVLNAAMLYWPMSNVLYVEGYALDRFAEGFWALQPVHQNTIGLILDAGIEEDLRLRHLQVVDAARASLGLSIVECAVTDTPLKVEKKIDPSTGKSTGRIQHPESLLRAVDTLVTGSRVNAVAVVARFPDDDGGEIDDYRQGMIGYTFLPCVLAGLSTAPQYLVKSSGHLNSNCIVSSDVDSVILPVDACGGDGALAFAGSKKAKPLIVVVEENETVLNDTPDKLGINAVYASNYWEAIGIIAAHKAGVDPNSLRRNRIKNLVSTSSQSSNGYAISGIR